MHVLSPIKSFSRYKAKDLNIILEFPENKYGLINGSNYFKNLFNLSPKIYSVFDIYNKNHAYVYEIKFGREGDIYNVLKHIFIHHNFLDVITENTITHYTCSPKLSKKATSVSFCIPAGTILDPHNFYYNSLNSIFLNVKFCFRDELNHEDVIDYFIQESKRWELERSKVLKLGKSEKKIKEIKEQVEKR